MDRKEAINILKGIIATNDSYAEARTKISKDHSDTSWIDYVVLMSSLLGDLDVLKLAHLSGGGLEARDEAYLYRTPAHSAAGQGHLSCLKYLAKQEVDLQAEDIDGETPAHRTAFEGHLSCLKYLVEQGVDLRAKDKLFQTPAHKLARYGHLSCLEYLSEQGVDLEAKDEDGLTPAHQAALGGHLSCLKYLAEQDVDLETKDKYGETPRNLACQYRRRDIVNFIDAFLAEKSTD